MVLPQTAPAAAIAGIGASDITLSLSLTWELPLTGTFMYVNTYPAAIRIAASGAVNLKALVTSHHPLENTAEAPSAAQTSPDAIKSIVRPEPTTGAAHHANDR